METPLDDRTAGAGVLEKTNVPSSEVSTEVGINASGHKQELERNFNLLSICGVAVTTGVSWTSVGGSIVSTLIS
jgi:choline transport protein